MNAETLKLFNAIQVDRKDKNYTGAAVLSRTVRNGYVLDPAIQPTSQLLDTIEEYVGISGEKANATFHKSWQIVRDSDLVDLVLQQIVHYITTYGFERLGIYDDRFVYIPDEVLELPAIKDNLPLIYIKAMTAEEILNEIIVLGAKIALSENTLEDIMTIVKQNHYSSAMIEAIGNRELLVRLYDYFGTVPRDPTEFLRYVVYKLTGDTLLIKNRYLIKKIKAADGDALDKYLEKAPTNLGTIFFRFKPLLLAMKSISHNKTFFNQLRKRANYEHLPLGVDYLNNVTSQIAHGTLDLNKLDDVLKHHSIYRKIRLAYALKFRFDAGESIVYKVRNGRGYATEFVWDKTNNKTLGAALTIVDSAIADDMRKNVGGRMVYIPEQIYYALPATEKQFCGNLPNGSYAAIDEDMIIGVHWTDVDRIRIDLDLSMMDAAGKYGWDAAYRNDMRSVLFSGDVTSAPKPDGATELWYIAKTETAPKSVFLNYYNYYEDVPVPFKLFLAHEKINHIHSNYMVDVNNIVAYANMEINQPQVALGLVIGSRFYFSTTSIGNTISMRNMDIARQVREYELAKAQSTIDLAHLLEMAGATVVHEMPEEPLPDGAFINLSLEAVDKTSFLKLLQ